jgi:hypothetical protein
MAWTPLTKRAIGYLITKGNDVDVWIDDLNFLHTRTRGLWVPATMGTGVNVVVPSHYNQYPSVELVNGQNNQAYMGFAIPVGATILSKAVVVLIAAGSNNLNRSVLSEYAANGEAYNTHTSTIAAGLVAVTSGQIKEDDISSALADLTAGDRVGIQYARITVGDTVAASVHVLGVWIEYY